MTSARPDPCQRLARPLCLPLAQHQAPQRGSQSRAGEWLSEAKRDRPPERSDPLTERLRGLRGWGL